VTRRTVTMAADPTVGSMRVARPHVLGRLLRPEGVGAAAKWRVQGILCILAAVGLLTLRSHVLTLSPPYVYQREIKQDYLLARALLDGANPYVDLPLLTERYLPAATPYVTAHPVPHPPPVAVLFTPLALLSYETASAIWLAVDLSLLLALTFLIASTRSPKPPPTYVLAASCALLLWQPVWAAILLGQLSMALATLLVGSWVAFRTGRNRLAGVLLGAAIAVKLIPIVVAGYFLVKRVKGRWQVLLWTTISLLASFAISTLALGADGMRTYLLEALPANAMWRTAEGNYSLTSGVWRFFAGSQAFSPVVGFPQAADVLSNLAAVAVLAATARLLVQIDDPDVGFALATCAMLLVSPIVWQHYFVLLVWPLWVVAQQLHADGWKAKRTNLFLMALVMLAVPTNAVFDLTRAFASLLFGDALQEPLPAVAGLPLAAIYLGPVLLFSMLASAKRQARSTAAPEMSASEDRG